MVYCCVPHCTSRSGKSKGISFHYFPCDSSLEQKWLKAISRENFKPNSNANSVSQAVCSLHFQDSDYKTGLKKRCLKPHSIPSIFPGYPSYKIPKLVPTRRLPERKNLETILKKGDVGDSVQPKISFSAPERRADMYEKLMNRLEERRRAREEIAVKGKDSFDGNPPDCAPNSLNFNVPEKTADMYEKKMNMLKERHSVTGGIAVKSRHRYCCVVPNCHSSNKEEKISFHEIPSDNNRRLLWLKAISRQGPSKDSPWIPSQYSVVCQKHFKEDDYIQYDNHYYIENKIRRLKRSAVPSLFLPKPSLDKIEAIYFKNTTSVKMSDQQGNGNVDYIKCSVPGCQTKSHRKTEHNIEEENILMFPMPHSDWLFNKWKEPLKGYKIELPRDGHICERHFLEKDIERYDRTKTPDGDIVEIRKRIPALRPDAIPIKFLKPPYSVKRKSPAKELTFQNSVRNLTDKTSLTLNSCDSGNSAIDSEDDFSDDSPVNSTEERISHKKKCLSYSELVKNIQLVKKPSKSWSVVCTDEFTIFASWNNKFIAEKRLVIESSLTVRVFLKDWEIEMTDLVDLTTVDDVSLLLEKVESYSMDSTC